MNWRLAVIPVTLIPIIIIAIQFDISAEDVFAIGAIPFTLAVIAIMAKLGNIPNALFIIIGLVAFLAWTRQLMIFRNQGENQ